MKKALLLLPALALALAACTPASPDSAAENTAESAAAPQDGATAETAAFPVGRLVEGDALQQTGDAYYMTSYDTPAEDEAPLPYLVKLDFATATEEVVWRAEEASWQFSAPVVRDGQAYLTIDSTLYRIPLDGGEATATPLPEETSFSAADEYGLYSFVYERASNTVRGSRMDLQTGQITELAFPAQTESVWAVGESRFLLTRLVTEAPLPDPQEFEMYDAALQNATREYDWFDPATGALEKIFEEPYYPVSREDGSALNRWFLGENGQRLYFGWVLPDGTGGVESCALDGTGWQAVDGLPEDRTIIGYLKRNGMLCWLMGGPEGAHWIFDLDSRRLYQMPNITSGVGFPEALLGSDLVMVADGEQPNIVSGWALISAEEYLNGSTGWIPVTRRTDTAS